MFSSEGSAPTRASGYLRGGQADHTRKDEGHHGLEAARPAHAPGVIEDELAQRDRHRRLVDGRPPHAP